MGISSNTLRFILESKDADFGRTLVIGRQSVCISPETISKLLGVKSSAFAGQWRFESILKVLGAKEIHTMDVFDYEGANLIHDLNCPVPHTWHSKYDVLIDGGCLEHVYDVPCALNNYMDMVKIGGVIFMVTVANNFVGHGFYQFSPELFYRVFNASNGFRLERIVLCEEGRGQSRLFGVNYEFGTASEWRVPVDPDTTRRREMTMTSNPIVLLLAARKIGKKPRVYNPVQAIYPEDRPSLLDGKNQSKWGMAIVRKLTKHLPESVWRDKLPKLLWLLDPFRHRRFLRRHSLRRTTHHYFK